MRKAVLSQSTAEHMQRAHRCRTGRKGRDSSEWEGGCYKKQKLEDCCKAKEVR